MSEALVVGRYTLFAQIASGGMASVYLGRMRGEVGFGRTVAIKRMHPHLAKDPGLVAMFVDEARLAARVHHPNVVPMLDVVTTGNELLIVMEYVPGEALHRLSRASQEAQALIPVPVAAAIAVQLLGGLHAAHEARDEDGRPLAIVHRDVSPQNVLVGAEGVTRVLDFGVAKAATRVQTTREGQLKGKIAYMAPEQLTGGEVTRSADIYAAGVVLWETLSCRRLFHADTEGALVRMILEGAVLPPSHHNPEVTPELDRIVARALSAVVTARYATAQEMAEELDQAVRCASSVKVAQWVAGLAEPALKARRGLVAVVESGSLDREGVQSYLDRVSSPPDAPEEPTLVSQRGDDGGARAVPPAPPSPSARARAARERAPSSVRLTDEFDDAMMARARARLGTTLGGKYRLDRVLGIGGMATVFAATHRNQAEMAVKILHQELSMREDLKRRFLREGYVGNSVKHPGAVLVMDDDVAEDGAAFLVMELLRGRSVEDVWERNGRALGSRVVTAMALELLDVLVAAHDKTIVHRDLKPANLFLCNDGGLKVLDFGIARLRDALEGGDGGTRTGALMGTPAFMAPEQAQGLTAEVDAQTDLWAVGATMYTLLSGRLVHEADNASLLLIRAGTSRAGPLLAVAPRVEMAIAEVVDQALRFDKGSRWKSAAVMRDALRAAAVAVFGQAPGRDVLTGVLHHGKGSAPSEGRPIVTGEWNLDGAEPGSGASRRTPGKTTAQPTSSELLGPVDAPPAPRSTLAPALAAAALVAVCAALAVRAQHTRSAAEGAGEGAEFVPTTSASTSRLSSSDSASLTSSSSQATVPLAAPPPTPAAAPPRPAPKRAKSNPLDLPYK